MQVKHVLRAIIVWAACTSLVGAQVPDLIHWGEAQVEAEAEKQAEDAILRAVGEAAGISAPIALNQNDAYPEVPPLQNFHPAALQPSVDDLRTVLPAGDYSIPVIGYCTRSSAHFPGRGLAYKLAPLKGPQAPAMAALLVRGAVAQVPPGSLQSVAWFIQWGTPLDSMGAPAQALIHQLIPEFENSLKGDFLDKVQFTYDKFKAVPGLPPLDSLLERTEEGQYIMSVRRARATLMDRTISAEEMPDRLYQPTGDGLPRVLPDANPPAQSPWQQLRPGLYARFTFTGGFSSQNLFEFRITPDAVRPTAARHPGRGGLVPVSLAVPAAGWTLEEVLGGLAPFLPEAAPILVGAGVVVGFILIAYAIGGLAQPLSIAPILIARGRGNQDPFPIPKPLNPGKDTDGKCHPCPPIVTWSAPGNEHGSTTGTHWHGIVWDQDPKTCICYPKRVSGPTKESVEQQ
ncbi:MAG: hypothetical protein JSS29_19395 [Proteobacteria bacterium]|nr:hypothetical protein [Pseudomonadota bacterium]